MRSLSQYIYEEMQEKNTLSCTLSTFFSIYKKSRSSESVEQAKKSFLKNINMYSDGGPRDKEEWLSSALSSSISLDIYKGYDGIKERVEVLFHAKPYDDMKMVFYMTGRHAKEWSETGKAIWKWSEENKNKHLD